MKNRGDVFWYILLILFIIVLSFISLFIGNISIFPLTENTLFILENIRIPRLIMCILCGCGLSVCGCAYQAIFRNPLSDPYILGVSSGASLGAALAIVLHLDSIFFGVSFMSFFFAMLSVFLIIKISSVGNRLHTTTLLLSGIAINFLMSALISILMIFNQQNMDEIIFWTMGSVSVSRYSDVLITFFSVFISITIILIYAKDLNALLLGGDSAKNLGVNVEKTKKVILFFSTLMVGIIVSFCGVIGFVGLIVPHIVRIIVGADNRRLIPFSILGGIIFMLIADILSRTLIFPSILPIGAITSLVGAPFFIYLLYNAKKQLNP
ncbi:MAG: iron ABC transporter permease [Bacteroidales bacterium]|nr:iron ABC transporter permease [Bacteroidales bacterium]